MTEEATLAGLLRRKDGLDQRAVKLAKQVVDATDEIVDAATSERDTAHAKLKTIAGDPPVAQDGKCFVCRRTRPQIAIAHGDPFCSTECAKTWHAKPARRLDLIPEQGVLIKRNNRLLVLTSHELCWIIEDVIPRIRGKARAGGEEEQ